MKRHEFLSILRDKGYVFLRQAKGSHELWQHELWGATVLVSTRPTDPRASKNFLAKLARIERDFTQGSAC